MRLMLLLYSAYPLGWFMKSFVKGTQLRHLYAIVFGIILQTFMYRTQVYHPFIMTAVTYLLMIVLPRRSQHTYVMGFNLLYLSGQHIYRMITNFGGWDMDITTQTMLLTARLSSLGFCYKDGAMKEDELLKEQQERKIEKLPTVLEMLSYSYFCCGCLIGPFYEYHHYIDFIEQKGLYTNIPTTVWPAIKRFLQGQLCLAIHLVLGNYFWVQYCGTKEFTEMSFFTKVIYYYVAMTNQRLLYYTSWCIIDGGIISSGFGYNGKDPKTDRNHHCRNLNCHILEVELGNSPSFMMLHWNCTIQSWLRHYIYNRCLTPGKKPALKENMITFIVSAFWHGFYPFYYVMFFFCALLSELSRDVFRSKILFSFLPKSVGFILANFLSMLAMNYMGICFGLLTFEKGMRFSGTMHHFVFVIITIFFVIFRFSGIVQKAQRLQRKKDALKAEQTATAKKTD